MPSLHPPLPHIMYPSELSWFLTNFDGRISNTNDTKTWRTMSAIKSNILRRMDDAPAGVRVCCIKFVQKVVQAQTAGMISDPRVRRYIPPKRHAFVS